MEIREQSPSDLEEYARIPIALELSRMLDLSVLSGGLGGFGLVERPVTPTFVKDYDALTGCRPTDWATRFDLSNWGFLSARLDGECVGGVAIAVRTPSLLMLEDRSDLAVVWDLRVSPNVRRRGVGTALFVEAAQWAERSGCRRLKVEIQNINVPACRLYASQDCTLGSIHRFAYPDIPEEVQLLWYRNLGDRGFAAAQPAAAADGLGPPLSGQTVGQTLWSLSGPVCSLSPSWDLCSGLSSVPSDTDYSLAISAPTAPVSSWV
jgi:GNAT superfamily N-acetyltransferase